MNKMMLFVVFVVLGTVGMLFLANQGQKPSQKSSNDISSVNLTQETKPTTEITPTPQISGGQTSTQEAKTTTAVIKTNKGDIMLLLYDKDAPKTVENFTTKAKNGFYNNLTFHRVEDWIIQGGDPLGNGTGGATMPTELNDKPFVVGSLGVARGQDIKISNDAQFFITKKDASWLTGQYTNFGIVKEGMGVVNKIEVGDKILKITVEESGHFPL